MLDLETILSLSMPMAPSNEKATAATVLKVVNEQLESELLCMPDNKEDLWKDQKL